MESRYQERLTRAEFERRERNVTEAAKQKPAYPTKPDAPGATPRPSNPPPQKDTAPSPIPLRKKGAAVDAGEIADAVARSIALFNRSRGL
jgi:hypothetical protein